MKCRNCGYTFHGITCPLCGKKNIGAKRCSVCSKVVYPGNQRCLHCGNPIRGNSHAAITSFVSTDKHTLNSHTYTFDKGYDYKKSAYEYKGSVQKQPNKQPFKVQRPIVQAFVIVLVSALIITLVGLNYSDETVDYITSDVESEDVDEGNISIHDLAITGDISSLQKQCNYANTQVIDQQGEDIYFNALDLYKTNHKFLQFDTVSNITVDSNFYVDGDVLYYVDFISGICVRNNGVQTILDEKGINLQKIQQKLYYQDEDSVLYCYDLDKQDSEIIGEDIQYFYIDENSETIYFNDYDYRIKKMNLDGTGIVDLNLEAISFIVDGAIMYVCQWGDSSNYYLRAYDMEQKAIVMEFQEENIQDIARYEDSFIFSDDFGKIYRKFDTRDKAELLFDGKNQIYSFQLIGDKILVGVFDENYYIYWYLLDYNGHYARIITG